jgi:hypothetical protein
MAEPVVTPIYASRLAAPLRNKFESLVERGQAQIDQWVETGKEEDARSRALAKTAWFERVDSSLDYLSNDVAVQELVQSQGVSLVDEVLEETRERTVSADSFLETFVRSILRRPPRQDISPSPEVQAQASPYQKVQGKVVRRV